MTKEEFQVLRDLMREEIGTALQTVNKRLDQMQASIDSLRDDVELVKEDTEITRMAVNALGEWAENVAVVTAVTYPVQMLMTYKVTTQKAATPLFQSTTSYSSCPSYVS